MANLYVIFHVFLNTHDANAHASSLKMRANNACIISHFTIQNGVTSLMLASQNGHVEVVEKLLQHGARVDLQNEVGFTNYGNHSFGVTK